MGSSVAKPVRQDVAQNQILIYYETLAVFATKTSPLAEMWLRIIPFVLMSKRFSWGGLVEEVAGEE